LLVVTAVLVVAASVLTAMLPTECGVISLTSERGERESRFEAVRKCSGMTPGRASAVGAPEATVGEFVFSDPAHRPRVCRVV
jgi:hypothetical protein